SVGGAPLATAYQPMAIRIGFVRDSVIASRYGQSLSRIGGRLYTRAATNRAAPPPVTPGGRNHHESPNARSPTAVARPSRGPTRTRPDGMGRSRFVGWRASNGASRISFTA